MCLLEWRSQILHLTRQFLLLFKKVIQLISFSVKDIGYQSCVMQYIPVKSCLFVSKTAISTIVFHSWQKLIELS